MFFGAYAGYLGVPVVRFLGNDVKERSCRALALGSSFVCVKTPLAQRPDARTIAFDCATIVDVIG